MDLRAGPVATVGGTARQDVHPPADPRAVLTSIGVAVYDWNLVTDAIDWAVNGADVLGLPSLAGLADGTSYANLVEPGSGTTRAEAIGGSTARDGGNGVPYAARYGLQPEPGRIVTVEDTGRWYAGADGRPAAAHGMLRVVAGAGVSPSGEEGPGQRERIAFLRKLASEVAESGRSRRPVTIFVLSIADLPELNDTFGFEGGDAVIAAVLARLAGVMRRRDSFTRYSGNRFALALRGCGPDQARIAADRLEAALATAPVETGRGSVSPRLLIGAASAPDHALDPAGLLRRAEQSLAIAKRRSGPSLVIYDPQVFRSTERRPREDGALDVVELLNARRVVFARQAVVDAATRKDAFGEALMRIRGEDGRVTSAGDVVPAIERAGLVPLVDMRMLELVVSHLAAHPGERLSINLSPLTLDSPDWLATLASYVGQRADIAPRLIIEITETVAIRDPEGARRKMDAMKALGVAIAIDDFGAGHTSFKHLRNFPVDMVKIDGAFVQNLSRNPDDGFFVRTLIDLAHHLGLSTVAEWVEDEETAHQLASWGVDYLQGDHCGVPLIAEPPALARIA